jgi:hypothetical protein
MKLVTKCSQYDGQKPNKRYFLHSKSKGNEIGSSTRINQWDSEETTLNEWINNEGLSVSDITSFSKRVTLNEHQSINILSEEDPHNNKQSIGKIQLMYDDKIIQTNRLGRFSDKFQAKRYVHAEAMRIKDGKKTISPQSGESIQIKQEFFDGMPNASQLIYKPGMDYDCIVEKDTLNPHIWLVAYEILDVASDLKQGKTISEIIEIMYYSPHCYYIHPELTEQQLILFEKEYFSKRLNPLIEYICKMSNDAPEGLIVFQNNTRVKNRNPQDYVYTGEEDNT